MALWNFPILPPKFYSMSDIGVRLTEFLKKRNIRLDRNIITYLICVLIATILWFLNALNKEYSAEISYPVKYVNLPQEKYLVSELPSHFLLEVKAKGFALLRHRISTSFLPITFNVNAYTNHSLEKKEVFEYTINTNDVKDRISGQLSSDINLQGISPENIHFRFALSEQKKLPVHPAVHYTLKRQYILNNITVIPDSIEISGPAPIVDTLTYISTQPFTLKNIGKNITRTVSLVPIPGCTFSATQAEVSLFVEQFTEARRTFPIQTLQVPDSLILRIFPGQVNVTYDIGLSKYDHISDQDFTFTVEFSQTQNSSFLDVKAIKVPPFIRNLTYTPQRVEYILEKK